MVGHSLDTEKTEDRNRPEKHPRNYLFPSAGIARSRKVARAMNPQLMPEFLTYVELACPKTMNYGHSRTSPLLHDQNETTRHGSYVTISPEGSDSRTTLRQVLPSGAS
jgi:hypothetical protein